MSYCENLLLVTSLSFDLF